MNETDFQQIHKAFIDFRNKLTGLLAKTGSDYHIRSVMLEAIEDATRNERDLLSIHNEPESW